MSKKQPYTVTLSDEDAARYKAEGQDTMSLGMHIVLVKLDLLTPASAKQANPDPYGRKAREQAKEKEAAEQRAFLEGGSPVEYTGPEEGLSQKDYNNLTASIAAEAARKEAERAAGRQKANAEFLVTYGKPGDTMETFAARQKAERAAKAKAKADAQPTQPAQPVPAKALTYAEQLAANPWPADDDEEIEGI